MVLPPRDFESRASTNSAIPASMQPIIISDEALRLRLRAPARADRAASGSGTHGEPACCISTDSTGAIEDLRFPDIVSLLAPDDLLVVNDTRVIKARLHGHKDSGGEIEVLVERIAGRTLRAGAGAREQGAQGGAAIDPRRRGGLRRGPPGRVLRARVSGERPRIPRRARRGAAAAVHHARGRCERRSALPDRVRANARRGGRAHGGTALRRRAAGNARRERRRARFASRCTSARARSSRCAPTTSRTT